MIFQIVTFVAAFLVVFALYLEFSNGFADTPLEAEDERFRKEGQRRRTEAVSREAWDANKQMYWK